MTLLGKMPSKQDRFDPRGCKATMMAAVTTGNGGYEKLDYREVPVPELAPGEVLLQVLAAGVNNTEINTRLGWYSSSVTTSTERAADAEENGARPKQGGMKRRHFRSSKALIAAAVLLLLRPAATKA